LQKDKPHDDAHRGQHLDKIARRILRNLCYVKSDQTALMYFYTSLCLKKVPRGSHFWLWHNVNRLL